MVTLFSCLCIFKPINRRAGAYYMRNPAPSKAHWHSKFVYFFCIQLNPFPFFPSILNNLQDNKVIKITIQSDGWMDETDGWIISLKDCVFTYQNRWIDSYYYSMADQTQIPTFKLVLGNITLKFNILKNEITKQLQYSRWWWYR